MYIKVFDGAAVIFCEEQDRPCTHPDGHELNPDRGAINGEYGSCCIHCSHYVGRHEYFNGAAEAQAYAQVMLGATGPVEVREIEWKWGPGDVPKSPIVSAAKSFELLFDNGGGITLITPNYCHSYDDPQWAAQDVAALLDGADPKEWDGNHPEFRRERHPEDDVMTAAMAQVIREGSPWTRRGHAWNEFCAALAPSMTQDEMLLAERAADTLVDLIRSLESRDPQHPEIATLNKLYGEILHAAVRCIPRVNIEEVRRA